MANDLKNAGGVGMNTSFEVLSDGIPTGRIGRHGNSVRVYGHYDLRIADFKSFPEAKAAAVVMAFPTKKDAYEQVCARVEANRKNALEQKFVARFAGLARALATGSNSAADEIKELVIAIDKLAADRQHSSRKPENARTANWSCEYLFGDSVMWAFGSDCIFPSPPIE